MTCQQCGSFIAPPNQNILYSGPICTCPKKLHDVNPFTGQVIGQQSDAGLGQMFRPEYIGEILNRLHSLEVAMNRLPYSIWCDCVQSLKAHQNGACLECRRAKRP